MSYIFREPFLVNLISSSLGYFRPFPANMNFFISLIFLVNFQYKFGYSMPGMFLHIRYIPPTRAITGKLKTGGICSEEIKGMADIGVFMHKLHGSGGF